MTLSDATGAWRTSSYSGPEGECVEVALTADAARIRDSKDPGGPTLCVSAAAWAEFLAHIRRAG